MKIKTINKLNRKLSSGFTILETMIAVSLFTIVVMIGMNALLNANVVNQKSQGMRSIMDNLSFVMEDLSKNLRTGYHIHCFSGSDIIPATTSPIVSTPKSCANGWGISFEAAEGSPSNDNDQWIYYISSTGKVFKAITGPYTVGNFVQLTPDEVTVDFSTSGFSVLGAESPANLDRQQPLVTIRLIGTITFKNVVTPFYLQTAVSQRLIDV